jgi:hypothetical protein
VASETVSDPHGLEVHPVKVVFWVFAIASSTFLGVYALDIIGRPVKPEETRWKPSLAWTPGIVYQVALNFAGSLVGWIALFYFCFHRQGLGVVDLAVAAIAILGVF